jgi:hypothetical protein
MLAAVAMLALAATGCDQVSSLAQRIPFLNRGGTDTAAVDTAAVTQPGAEDTTALAQAPVETGAPAPAAQPPAAAEPQERPARQVTARYEAPSQVLVDEPWFPTDTGTVRPGMTRMEVVTLWGMAVAERVVGSRTYLYFRNGCEVTCGTFDVVFLEDDQVVDAIVRGFGHTYAGISSSPPDREAEPTLPGLEEGDAGEL